jgi:hypothetical protein
LSIQSFFNDSFNVLMLAFTFLSVGGFALWQRLSDKPLLFSEVRYGPTLYTPSEKLFAKGPLWRGRRPSLPQGSNPRAAVGLAVPPAASTPPLPVGCGKVACRCGKLCALRIASVSGSR